MTDVKSTIVDWAHWAVANHDQFNYTEGPNRMEGIGKPGQLPVWADCSASITLYYNWAGAPDPNGQNYDGEGYTGTLLSHGTVISVDQAVPGDVIVYGPGTGWHTALIVEAGPDPLTVSHGEQGDPNYCRVSQDGRQPQTYLRFDTTQIAPSHSPNAQPPVPTPTPTPTPHIAGDEEMAAATYQENNMTHVIWVDNTGTLHHKFQGIDGPLSPTQAWGEDAFKPGGLLPNATPVVKVTPKFTHVYVRGAQNGLKHFFQQIGSTNWNTEQV